MSISDKFGYPKVLVNKKGMVVKTIPQPSNTALADLDILYADPSTPVSQLQQQLPPDVALVVSKLIPKTYSVTVTDRQVQIPLPTPPLIQDSVELIVNGFVYKVPDVTITDSYLIWTNTDFILEASDSIYLKYI